MTGIKLDTATQLRISRRIIQFHIKEHYTLLEAFRKAAPFEVYNLRQLTSIKKGMTHALMEARVSLTKGNFWREEPQKVEVSVATGLMVPCSGVSKEHKEFIAKPRKHRVLVVGALDSQVQYLKSSVFDVVNLDAEVRPGKLRAASSAADYTIVWVTKVSHSVTDLLTKLGVPIIYARGLSSIKESIHSLERKEKP